MGVQRVFLDWDQPLLPRAAQWLLTHIDPDDADLSQALVIVPGARAGRRLSELLAQIARTHCLALAPPRLTTPGPAAEQFYFAPQPIADSLTARLAWARHLIDAPTQQLQQVVAVLPNPHDTAGWLRLADDLNQTCQTLAAANLSCAQVAEKCHAIPDFQDQPALLALDQLRREYEQRLEAAGLLDRDAARRFAIDTDSLAAAGPVILIGTAELPPILTQMLARIPQPVTTLIQAPQHLADQFDNFGCIHNQNWARKEVDLQNVILRTVDDTPAQEVTVVEALGRPAQTSTSPGSVSTAITQPLTYEMTHHPGQITVGLADESLGPGVARSLQLGGVAAHLANRRTLAQTLVGLLLPAIAELLNQPRLSSLARFLRHPQVESAIDRSLGHAAGQQAIAQLDQLIARHLDGRLDPNWLKQIDDGKPLLAVIDFVLSLLEPMHADQQPASAWAQPIVQMLRTFYGDLSLHTHSDRQDAADWHGLDSLASILRILHRQSDRPNLMPRLTGPEMLQHLTGLLAQQPLPDPPDAESVELLGWLELALDDAPQLVICGFNEEHVPGRPAVEPLLGEAVRRQIGLVDRQQRLARDTYALTTMTHNRDQLTLIAARRTREGEPLTPSRLILKCDDQLMLERITNFYGESSHPTASPGLLEHANHSELAMHVPRPPQLPIDRLHVTAFSHYLDCPYRFYLRFIEKLDVPPQPTVEMDPAMFGNLAHDVLAQLGQSPLADTDDSEAIAAFLDDQLDRQIAQQFSQDPSAAVLLQREQLRLRFSAFANWQAASVAEGWRIDRDMIERSAGATLNVDGRPFRITGRIDRIDRHPDLGVRVIDYKTADAGHTPEKTHRKGRGDDKRWVNLQLPLYRRLAESLGITQPLALGFVLLPKDHTNVTFSQADWSTQDLDDAEQVACDVVRNIRNGVFWPPNPNPRVDHGLSALTWDMCVGREHAIEQVSAMIDESRQHDAPAPDSQEAHDD